MQSVENDFVICDNFIFHAISIIQATFEKKMRF